MGQWWLFRAPSSCGPRPLCSGICPPHCLPQDLPPGLFVAGTRVGCPSAGYHQGSNPSSSSLQACWDVIHMPCHSPWKVCTSVLFSRFTELCKHPTHLPSARQPRICSLSVDWHLLDLSYPRSHAMTTFCVCLLSWRVFPRSACVEPRGGAMFLVRAE